MRSHLHGRTPARTRPRQQRATRLWRSSGPLSACTPLETRVRTERSPEHPSMGLVRVVLGGPVGVVREERLEPPRVATQDLKACASAYSAPLAGDNGNPEIGSRAGFRI